jgi:hypothetical protein
LGGGSRPFVVAATSNANGQRRMNNTANAQITARAPGTSNTTEAASSSGVFIMIGVRISKIIIYEELNACFAKILRYAEGGFLHD